MAMGTGTNYRREGAIIALAKAQRAREIMQCFKRASVKPSNINYKGYGKELY